jgi:hypothetical protein
MESPGFRWSEVALVPLLTKGTSLAPQISRCSWGGIGLACSHTLTPWLSVPWGKSASGWLLPLSLLCTVCALNLQNLVKPLLQKKPVLETLLEWCKPIHLTSSMATFWEQTWWCFREVEINPSELRKSRGRGNGFKENTSRKMAMNGKHKTSSKWWEERKSWIGGFFF